MRGTLPETRESELASFLQSDFAACFVAVFFCDRTKEEGAQHLLSPVVRGCSFGVVESLFGN